MNILKEILEDVNTMDRLYTRIQDNEYQKAADELYRKIESLPKATTTELEELISKFDCTITRKAYETGFKDGHDLARYLDAKDVIYPEVKT